MDAYSDPNARALRHVFGMDRTGTGTEAFSRFHYADAFQPLPRPTGAYPFRLGLEDVLGAPAVQAIATARKLVFHTVGDTGNYGHGGEAQASVAEHLVRQREGT